MKQVAIVGIQGVPAKYGGFETLVENIIGDNCCFEVRYTVFCSGKDYATRMKTYKGAQLKYIPLFHANGMQSTITGSPALIASNAVSPNVSTNCFLLERFKTSEV